MEVTQGNTKPEIRVLVVDDTGIPVNFADATGGVTVVGHRGDQEVFTNSTDTAAGGDVIVGSDGTVVCPWPDGATDTLGRMSLEIIAHWSAGPQSFWPTDIIEVVASPFDFITVTELTDYMSGVTLDDAQERAGRMVLRGLTRSLERKLARGFIEGVATERVYAAEDGYGLLRRSPVKAILAVNGLPLLPEGPMPQWGNYPFTPSPRHGGVAGLLPLAWHDVTYRGGGGLDDADLDDVRWAILEKASQIMTNRHDDTVSVKDLDTREPTFRGAMNWTPDELNQFDRLRRKIVL